MVSAKMAVISIAGVGVQLGLAILGRGGLSAFFGEPALVALTTVTAVSVVAALFTGASLDSGEREDRSNRWVLTVFSLIGLALAYLPAVTDRLDVLSVGGAGVRWFGVLVFAVGSWLRLWPVVMLGHRFSGLVAIQHNHQLLTTGLYTHIRHPSYLGLLVGEIGWALTFRSIVGLILTVITVPVLVARMNAEEALLGTHFGAEYEAYKQRTHRLVPGVY
jgi:protein-S-isoprenylcysteine O-methyltransferase Ste14